MRPENNDFDPKKMSFDDDKTYSLEDILSEYHFDDTMKSRRSKPPATPESLARLVAETDAQLESILSEQGKKSVPLPPPVVPKAPPLHHTPIISEDDTKHWAEALSVTQKPAAPPAPPPVTGEITSSEIDFSNNEDFQRMFSPSDDFMGLSDMDAPLPEAPPPVPKEPLRERINNRAVRLEETVKDTSPGDAAKKLIPYVSSLSLRTLIAFVLQLPLLYITCSHRFAWPVPAALDFSTEPYLYIFIVLAFQVATMFCGLDVLARGLSDLFRLRPSMETGVSAACLASIFHVLSILIFKNTWHAYLPYCAISSFSMFLAIWSARLRYGARLRTYMVAKNAEVCQSVTMEDRIWEDVAGVTKRTAAPEGFVPQTEATDNVQQFFNFFVPIALIASLVLAFLASFGKAAGKDFWWAWSAILSCVVPFTALFSFTLPFNLLSKRLASIGVALAGWSAARQMAKANVAVLTDSDIFPGETVSLNGYRMIGTYSLDKAISYTVSLIHASGSGLIHPFMARFKNDVGQLRRITDFQHYEGGGMGAYINDDRVLVGSYNFMVSMSVSVPADHKTKHAVYTSINMELVSVFALVYTPKSSVKTALHMLSRHKVQPLFAVRDFNLTAPLLKDKFKLQESQIDYPIIEERLQLSDPSRKVYAKPIAVAGKEGLLPYAECIVGSLSLGKVSKINLTMSTLFALVGLLLAFYFTYTGQASAASPVNMLLYQGLCSVPALLMSLWVSRY